MWFLRDAVCCSYMSCYYVPTLQKKDGLADLQNQIGTDRGSSQAEVGKDALEEVLQEEAKGGAQALRRWEVLERENSFAPWKSLQKKLRVLVSLSYFIEMELVCSNRAVSFFFCVCVCAWYNAHAHSSGSQCSIFCSWALAIAAAKRGFSDVFCIELCGVVIQPWVTMHWNKNLVRMCCMSTWRIATIGSNIEQWYIDYSCV